MWQKYADFTATKAPPTSDAQEDAELQQAIRLSLGTDQDEQLPRNEPASSSNITVRPPLPNVRPLPPLKREDVTDDMIDKLHEANEVAICNMYNRGITKVQLERMISIKCSTQRKYAIIAAIKAAVENMEKVNRIKAACYPADQSAPDGVASQGEKISELR